MAARPKLEASDDNGHTKVRHVRIPDSLWIPAAQKAQEDGETISVVIRHLLRAYLRDEGGPASL